MAGRRSILLAVAGQASSSIGNFCLTLATVRYGDAAGVGSVAIVFTLYSIFVTVSRSITSAPILVAPRRYPSFGPSIYFAFSQGAAVGLFVMVCAPFTGGVREFLFVLGLSLPFLLAFDAARNVYIARGQVGRSALLDLSWTVCQLCLTVLVLAMSLPVLLVFVAWSAGCVVSVLPSLLIERRGALGITEQVRLGGDVGKSLFWESFAAGVAQQANVFLAAGLLGTLVVGELRAAYTLFGPIVLIQSAVLPILMSRAGRMYDWAAVRIILLCGVLVGLLLSVSGALLSVAPAPALIAILGALGPEVQGLFLATGASAGLSAVAAVLLASGRFLVPGKFIVAGRVVFVAGQVVAGILGAAYQSALAVLVFETISAGLVVAMLGLWFLLDWSDGPKLRRVRDPHELRVSSY